MNQENPSQLTRCWKKIGVYGDLSCEKLPEYIHCRNCPEFTRSGRELFNQHEVSRLLLDEWTEKNAMVKTDEQLGDLSIVPFRLKDEWFALPTRFYVGANEIIPVHSVPHRSNKIFRGLVNINGELLCCISAYEVLGLSDKEYEETETQAYKRMVTIKNDEDVFVFSVDELLRAWRIGSDELRKPPATLTKSSRSYTQHVFIHEKMEIGIINSDNFFNTLKESLNQV